MEFSKKNLAKIPAVITCLAVSSSCSSSSKNVAKLTESVFVVCRSICASEGLSSDEADLEGDLGRNADLCIFNPDDRQD